MMLRKNRMGLASKLACMAARSFSLLDSSAMRESSSRRACARPPTDPFGRPFKLAVFPGWNNGMIWLRGSAPPYRLRTRISRTLYLN